MLYRFLFFLQILEIFYFLSNFFASTKLNKNATVTIKINIIVIHAGTFISNWTLSNKEIAKNIDSFLKTGRLIETTTDLYKIIEKSLSFIPVNERKESIKKSAARVFQALRIEVNNEFDVLIEFMEKLPNILKSGGRVAILTFHSGEDRIVKKAFKEMKNLGIYSDAARNVIRPSKEECHMNSRAKSTKMRWAIKD